MSIKHPSNSDDNCYVITRGGHNGKILSMNGDMHARHKKANKALKTHVRRICTLMSTKLGGGSTEEGLKTQGLASTSTFKYSKNHK